METHCFLACLARVSGISVNPDLSQMPVYVRAGAIICKQPLVQHCGQAPAGALELDVYAGKASSESELSFDDGESLDYLRGKYCRMAVNYKNSPGVLRFAISKPEGAYIAWFKKIKMRFIGFNPVSNVSVNGSSLNFSASKKDLTNVLSADELNYDGKEIILELSYKNDGKPSTNN